MKTEENKIIDSMRKKIDEKVIDKTEIEMPLERNLKVGDAVEVGFLKNAKIIDIYMNRYILVKYENIKIQNKEEVFLGYEYNFFDWNNVFLKERIKDTKVSNHKRYPASQTTRQLDWLFEIVNKNNCFDNPAYQRDYVWSLKDNIDYIDSVFSDRELGKFAFINHGYEYEQNLEIMDGKQRINCIKNFLMDKFKYKGYFWSELSKQDRMFFEGRSISVIEFDNKNLTKVDKLKIFININEGGVPQSDEHLKTVKKMLEVEEKIENKQVSPSVKIGK